MAISRGGLGKRSSGLGSIDLFFVLRKGLRRTRSILTALATVRYQGDPLHFGESVPPASLSYLSANSGYFRFVYTIQEFHDTFLIR